MIRLYHADFAYGPRRILQDLNLVLEPNTTLAIMGANGSGKTTLLNLLNLVLPFQGDYFWQDDLITPARHHEIRRRLGRVFQRPFMFNDTVRNNIELPLRLRGIQNAAERVRNYGALLKIEPLFDQSARKLSGGELARVSLARALVIEPQILLLDEPFSEIDFHDRADIARQVAGIIRASRMTTVIVTHDIDEAKLFANHIVLLADGTLKPWEYIK